MNDLILLVIILVLFVAPITIIIIDASRPLKCPKCKKELEYNSYGRYQCTNCNYYEVKIYEEY